MQNRICSEKNKEKELVSKINHELTPDVVYHRVYMDHSMDHIAQFLFYIICVNGGKLFHRFIDDKPRNTRGRPL
jgi:hypothetical protein